MFCTLLPNRVDPPGATDDILKGWQGTTNNSPTLKPYTPLNGRENELFGEWIQVHVPTKQAAIQFLGEYDPYISLANLKY